MSKVTTFHKDIKVYSKADMNPMTHWYIWINTYRKINLKFDSENLTIYYFNLVVTAIGLFNANQGNNMAAEVQSPCVNKSWLLTKLIVKNNRICFFCLIYGCNLNQHHLTLSKCLMTRVSYLNQYCLIMKYNLNKRKHKWNIHKT